ncbi:MAG: hypothetical protein V4525_14875 [Pseudomonadota bacterium]
MNTSKRRIMYASIITVLFLFTGLSVFAYVFWAHNKENAPKHEGTFSSGEGAVIGDDQSRNKIVFRHYHASDATFSVEEITLPFSDSIAVHTSHVLESSYRHDAILSMLPTSIDWKPRNNEVSNPGKPAPENSWIPFTTLPIGHSFYVGNNAAGASSRQVIASAASPSDLNDDMPSIIPSPIPEPEIGITLLIGSTTVAAIARKRKKLSV